ncbi:MAG TPA: hypothetical protein VEH83_09335 [Gemmatimonadales bacterium]|nr:hypothetical protein [Gemmatimonadales bacterium]
MRQGLAVPLIAASAALAAGSAARAQQPSAQLATLEVGQAAPDFAVTGATRYGILQDQVRLSAYRGKTVVLAFFFKARTRG